MTKANGPKAATKKAKAPAKATKASARATPAAPAPPRVGVVDTTFARVNMGEVAVATLRAEAPDLAVERVTVPGVKDLPAACRAFLDRGFDAVLACGWVGPETIDKTCGHEASLGLMQLRVLFGRPLLEVFVHEDEAPARRALVWAREKEVDAKVLGDVARERVRGHALNAVWMLRDPERLVALAGTGQRQGFPDAGPLEG